MIEGLQDLLDDIDLNYPIKYNDSYNGEFVINNGWFKISFRFNPSKTVATFDIEDTELTRGGELFECSVLDNEDFFITLKLLKI